MTPWIVACQAPLSKEFSRQESWSGLPFPSPGDLPEPEIKPRSPILWADSLLSECPDSKCLREQGQLTPLINLFPFILGITEERKRH